MDASLPVSPTWTSHRGSLSVTPNNEVGVGGPLMSPAQQNALSRNFFFLWGPERLMTTQIQSVAVNNEAL